MKALSVRPPWAQFIIYGVPLTKNVDLGGGRSTVELDGRFFHKNIENRKWKLPDDFKLPQRIYIHASKRDDPIEAVLDMCVKKIGLPFMMVMHMSSPLLGRGAIIGEVDIVGCVEKSDSPWFTGPYGFVLANWKGYKVPVPCKGKLGFFEPPGSLAMAAPKAPSTKKQSRKRAPGHIRGHQVNGRKNE